MASSSPLPNAVDDDRLRTYVFLRDAGSLLDAQLRLTDPARRAHLLVRAHVMLAGAAPDLSEADAALMLEQLEQPALADRREFRLASADLPRGAVPPAEPRPVDAVWAATTLFRSLLDDPPRKRPPVARPPHESSSQVSAARARAARAGSPPPPPPPPPPARPPPAGGGRGWRCPSAAAASAAADEQQHSDDVDGLPPG